SSASSCAMSSRAEGCREAQRSERRQRDAVIGCSAPGDGRAIIALPALRRSMHPQPEALAVIAGRECRRPLEQLAEAGGIGVAAAFDDFLQAEVGGFQQRLGPLHPEALDALERALAETGLEM